MLNNKQKTILLNIIANPFFLAIPVALIIILFLPNPSSKYKIELVSKKVADKKDSDIAYYDLNNDREDERIIAFHNTVKGEASIKVLTNDGINYDAWNFHGHFQKSGQNFFCCDLDKDGWAEIFVHYYREDSAFLGAIIPFPDKEYIFREKFISKISKRDGRIDYLISDHNLADLNNDGMDELVFYLQSGLSRQPRVIVAYDLYCDSVSMSSSFGAFFSKMAIFDINNDGLPEIYTGSSTPANVPDSLGIPNSDYYSWYFGFSNKLEPLFEPIKNIEYPSSVRVCGFVSDEGERYIAACFADNINKTFTVDFFNSNNEIISKKLFTSLQLSKSRLIVTMKSVKLNNKNYVLVGSASDEFILINEKLQEERIDLVYGVLGYRLNEDLNNDDKNEFIFITPDYEIVIYDHNLKNPAKYKTGIPPLSAILGVGMKHNGNMQNEIFVKSDNYLRLLTYQPDYLYYLKYPIWFSVYLIIVLILWLSQRIQHVQEKRKQQIEETINSLQMKTIKSQMDPHFMFNVLNGLANNVASGNTEEAHDQIMRFSLLLRSMMKRTDKIDIRLADEIEFVSSYLELEKFRFKDDFDFEINLEESVDKNIRIPRMLIQLLVENAIKHGLRNKEGLKTLKVDIRLKVEKTTIVVEDNGVGRKEAMLKTRDTGKGMKLIHDMIRLNRKLGGKEITIAFIDLHDETGKAGGTRVEVVV